MIVGLVRPDAGEVYSDQNVTSMPMHLRARLGIGYLPQEESILENLPYENIMAVLETMNFGRSEMIDMCYALMKRFGIDKLATTEQLRYLEEKVAPYNSSISGLKSQVIDVR